MMAIRVQYRTATNSRGARLHVTNGEKSMTVAYKYGDDDHEKLKAAKAFVKKFMPYAPEIDPEPCTFKGDNFYRFVSRKT